MGMNEPPLPTRAGAWPARYCPDLAREPASAQPAPGDPDWRLLRQHCLPNGPEPRFQPGWARVQWNERALRYEAVLKGRGPKNAACGLNERTWELGDICEIFFQDCGGERYLEIHVTPENQRLQLRWTPETFRAFVDGGMRDLSAPLVGDPAWLSSTARVHEDYWSVCAIIPAQSLPIRDGALRVGAVFLTAVCRYDCSTGPGFVLSSTAPLSEPSYHRRHEWDPLQLMGPV